MNRLRQLHLYLGCMFAPLLAFFALSGLWQNYLWNYYGFGPLSTHPRLKHLVSVLSTLHTTHGLKSGEQLSSPAMRIFVDLMALSLLATMALGVVMAFRFGRARVTAACLAAGVLVPLGLIALAVMRR